MTPDRIDTAAARLLAGALLFAATLTAQAAPRQWTVTELPGLGHATWARAINNRGEIAGTVGVAPLRPHPAYWNGGAVVDLVAGSPGWGVANAINDQGEVAFTHEGAVGIWKDGVATYLGITGEPAGINKSGAMVGYFYPSGQIAWGPQRAFVYRDGAVHQLPTLSNNPAAAGGINDRGVIVGYSVPPMSSDFRAVMWKDGILHQLPGLGGTNSIAGRITNRGVIMGMAYDVNGINHLVTWDVSGRLLRDYGPRLSGHAINDRGVIVGSHNDTGRPFLLDGDEFTWLLELPAMRAQGWTSFAPMDINDRGEIVGLAWKAGLDSEGRALLLQPR